MGKHCVILLLVTIMMVSGILVPCVRAAGPLVVDFNGTPPFGVRPLDVQFYDTSSSADPANNTYLWDFGDGNTSIAENPLYTYVTSGAFTVNLTVVERTGNNATLSKPFYIHVGDATNTTDFSGTPQCGFSPLSVQFIDGTTLPHDQWEWNFGDSGASNLSDPQYIYNGEGSWSVSLHIWNNSGGPQSIISKTDYIRVIPQGVASFSASGTGSANPLTVQFNDISTGFIAPVTYHWDFGDGGKSADQNPLHTYPNVSGLYNVTFTVRDNCGQVVTDTKLIIISEGSVVFQTTSVPGAPVADFTGIPTSGAAPLNVTFSDTSLNNPTSWNWSFGDGSYSAISNPVHTYTSNGNYTVSLTASNSMGSSIKTRIEFITVPGFLLAPPVQTFVNFTGTPTYGSIPLTVQFTDLSAGFEEPVTYHWNFGDGFTSTVRNVPHTYTSLGSYPVSLTVEGSDGFTETLEKSGYINTTEIPTLEFIISTEPTEPLTIADETTTPTPSPLKSQSPSRTESGLQSESLPMAQSISPNMNGYQEQSFPQDRSLQNDLLAVTPYNLAPPHVQNWSLSTGINTNDTMKMHIKSSTDWEVWVNDAMDGNKPDYTAGRMAEYNSGVYVIPDGKYLEKNLHVISFTGKDVELTNNLQLLESHVLLPEEKSNWMERPIRLSQEVVGSDTHLDNNQYRIVIYFNAIPY